MQILALTLTQAQWEILLNAILAAVVAILARFGIRVAKEAGDKVSATAVDVGTQIVSRLNTLEDKVSHIETTVGKNTEAITKLQRSTNGVAKTVDQVAHEVIPDV